MAFTPTFCPNPDCIHHQHPQNPIWYRRRGFYHTRRSGSVQRIQCTACSTLFSRETFSVHYWCKHTLDLRRIFSSINSASGIRDIAREMKVSDKVILNRLARLSRQAIGLQASLMEHHQIREDLVMDGFESFVYSQYFPNNFTLAVGRNSQMLYSCDYAQLRRKGRMTSYQKKTRDRLNKRYPIPAKEIDNSFCRSLHSLSGYWAGDGKGCCRLITDMKQEYKKVLDGSPWWSSLRTSGCAEHLTVSSRRVRDTSNPLMSVNYFDREIRKDQANHVRQTLQWSKSVNNAMDRMMIYGAYHNVFKPYRVKENQDQLHAEVAGIERTAIDAQKRRFFTKRYFAHRVMMDEGQWRTWYRVWKTPVYELKAEARVRLCA